MDPVAHALVGGSLAESGLKQRTALGTATLLIAATVPDIDVLAYLGGPYTALGFRRGVTHGVLAWLVFPLVITGVMVVWDRVVRRRGGRVPARPVVPSQLFVLGLMGFATHMVLDLLNTYGIRLLAPFSNQWFYGDTLFIADPWVWAVLGVGIVLGWWRSKHTKGERVGGRRPRWPPASVALAVVATYIGIMALSNVIGRSLVTRAAEGAGLGHPQRLMVAPRPLNPLVRDVVMEIDGRYRFGTWDWRSLRLRVADMTYDREPTDFGAAAATRGPEVRKFLSWARFPYFLVEEGPGGRVVYVGDARYTLDPRGGSWAAIAVR